MGISKVLRSYEVKNLNEEEFIKVVVNSLSRELHREIKIEIIDDEKFKIIVDKYEIPMSKRLIRGLDKPYGVDIYILEEARSQGFEFDDEINRYIRNCYEK